MNPFKWWKSHGTGILGFLATFCAGAVVIPNLIPPSQTKWWAAANLALGIWTMKRSKVNRDALRQPAPTSPTGDTP